MYTIVYVVSKGIVRNNVGRPARLGERTLLRTPDEALDGVALLVEDGDDGGDGGDGGFDYRTDLLDG